MPVAEIRDYEEIPLSYFSADIGIRGGQGIRGWCPWIPLSPQKKTYKELYFNLVGFFYAQKDTPRMHHPHFYALIDSFFYQDCRRNPYKNADMTPQQRRLTQQAARRARKGL